MLISTRITLLNNVHKHNDADIYIYINITILSTKAFSKKKNEEKRYV